MKGNYKMISLSRYDSEKYLTPIWSGNIVYNESVLPFEEKDGVILPISLAYDIDHIYEVRSSSLEILYKEGTDYNIENGRLVICPDGSIPVMKYSEYYPTGSKQNVKDRTGGGDILFIEGGFFHTKQLAVTYSHKDIWKEKVQQYQGGQLKKTVEKLQNRRSLRMVFFGDSIYTGCNSSGTAQGGSQAPFMPAWYDMVIEVLKKHYGYDDITYINRSRGGRKSYEGRDLAEDLVAGENADLVWIGFGMNDRTLNPDEHRRNIESIIETVKKRNPECEFILTAPMLANKEVVAFYCDQVYFIDEYNKLKGEGIAVMDVTTPHKYLLSRKSYRDMTGNNLNHPNDFLCRLYAQTALACLIEK